MTRRFVLLSVACATTLSSGAQADVTAIYREADRALTLTIEIASNGDVRAGDDHTGYMLWTGKRGYEVAPGPGGPQVTRTADTAAARAGAIPSSQIMRPWLPVDTVTINGRTGTRYFIGGKDHNRLASPVVISRDPALAMLAAGYRRYEAMQRSTFPGDDSPERVSFRRLIASGAPIDVYGMQLVSISRAPISRSRFRVPAQPVASELVRQRWKGLQAATASTDASDAQEKRRDRDRFIRRAVWADGRLWLLAEHGTLSSVAPGERSRRDEPTPGSVIELCVVDKSLMALDAEGRLSRLERGSWRTVQQIALDREPVRAISCHAGRVIVVTQRRLVILEDGGQRQVDLLKPLSGPIVRTAVVDAGTTLLLARAMGEWGGGLDRIDLSSGSVSETPKLGGPVNGVAPEPGRPGCVVATVGLVHFFPSGQIVEVCGETVRRLYYRPYTMETTWPADPPELPGSTVPFYTIVGGPERLWIAGGDGLYELAAGHPIAFRRMPAFEQIDGVWVSFAVQGLALVRTSVDAHVSLGGGTPLLVAR